MPADLEQLWNAKPKDANGAWVNLSTKESKQLIDEHPEMMVLDVRRPNEYTTEPGHIKGAKLIPVQQIQERWKEVEAEKTKPILVHCFSGVRSKAACTFLAQQGFTRLFHMPGGIMDWEDENYPLVQGEQP